MRNLIHSISCNLTKGTSHNRKKAYDEEGEIYCYKKDAFELKFEDSIINIPPKPQALSPMLAALIPTVIDLGLKITTKLLESRIKKYTAEYSVKKSNLEALPKDPEIINIPNITFLRLLEKPDPKEENALKEKNALKIVFMAHKVGTYKHGNDELHGIVYFISELKLDYSAAKTCGKDETFDYTIELEPTFIMGKEKKTVKLFPITMHSVSFGHYQPKKDDMEYTSDIILLPDGAILTEASVKIIESNPKKVSSQEILDTINAYKDDAKTIINNIINNLPEEKDDGQEKNKQG
jgi:hypothetical protein